ncbi:tyrosyl-DNA phosphodiesterase 2-like isoform X2 [Myxocyprinus asiaticus]|uniref:tyrosyl-DNA phosphodiesterase 2-like isoform X2 n=1 Tax=Myxocyprinus asiaticus TaxID=70543 RepID=UPI0022229744|nr:tyrosyl-DNA phosphodiesterase 2-like isoform X2 [Myxocyprinus asiaticus]
MSNTVMSDNHTDQQMSSLEETRTSLCEQFACVSGSDSAVAQYYLAENDWDMERALNSFFEAHMDSVFDVEDTEETKNVSGNKRKEVIPETADASGSKKKIKTDMANRIDLVEEPTCSSNNSKENQTDSGASHSEAEDSKLSIISWNVDGLDTLNLVERARSLCSYLALYTPDVVFLQELIPVYVQYLKKHADNYQFVEGSSDGYFTGIMLKKSRVKLLESEIICYPTTQMMRNLLVAQVTFLSQKLCLMTSHLESCKNQSEERMKQLRFVFQKIREAPDDVTVIFGGDTNLRDSEVVKVGGLPPGVNDVWEQLGKQEHCRYTWDTKVNSNKAVPYISRCRFDRIYLKSAKTGLKVTPDHMVLIGMEKVDCGRYTSDHWGIYCTFNT